MNRFTVEVPEGRLDLALCVSSGQVFRWRLRPDGRWLGVEGAHWYRVAEPSPGVFDVESNGGEPDFRSLFRLDWDGREVEAEILRKGPELEPYMGALRGLRVLRPASAPETLFCFLCTSNNNISRIGSMIGKLAAYGEVMAFVDGIELRSFPSMETIAVIGEEQLRAQGFGYRGATIPVAARQILDKPSGWLESLKQTPYENARQELLTLKGVGPKLADCICLFALDHTEAAPIDTHMWQALTRLYLPQWQGSALTEKKYRDASALLRERFGELAGWAQQILFFENVQNGRARRNEA